MGGVSEERVSASSSGVMGPSMPGPLAITAGTARRSQWIPCLAWGKQCSRIWPEKGELKAKMKLASVCIRNADHARSLEEHLE